MLFRTNLQYFVGDFSLTACYAVTINFKEVKDAPVQIRSDHNTGDCVPYSYRMVSGFFNVPYYLISNKGYETGPPVYSPYPRRLESQRQHFLLSYFKTLSVGPAGVELPTFGMAARCSTNWATGARCHHHWLQMKTRQNEGKKESFVLKTCLHVLITKIPKKI